MYFISFINMTFSGDYDGNAFYSTLHLVSCIYHTPPHLAFQDFYAKNVKNTTKSIKKH